MLRVLPTTPVSYLSNGDESMRLLRLSLLSVGLTSGVLHAQTPATLPSLIDRSRLTVGVDSFAVMVQGKPMGWQRHERTRVVDGWQIRDAIALGAMVEQESVVQLAADAQERTLRQRGVMRGKPMTIALDFTVATGGVRVRGTADTPSNRQGVLSIDTLLPAATVDDNAVAPLLLGVPWREAMHVVVPVVASGKGTLESTHLQVVGAETVTVPAGTFAVWRVVQESGGARVQFDITRQAPYRLVRMQQIGAPLEIVLVSSRTAADAAR